MDNLTILIADDHPVFRKGLRALLSTMSNVELVGEAASGEEAITLAEKLQPDVVLLDLQMPGGGGLNAIRSIVHTSPHIRILVVTMFEDDDSIFEAMRAGARGYVLKDTQDEEMERAILAVGNGEAIFSPAIALRMINFFAARPPTMTDLFPELTAKSLMHFTRISPKLPLSINPVCLLHPKKYGKVEPFNTPDMALMDVIQFSPEPQPQ